VQGESGFRPLADVATDRFRDSVFSVWAIPLQALGFTVDARLQVVFAPPSRGK
jgi:hypothetical protein